jgi:hypothetical protein
MSNKLVLALGLGVLATALTSLRAETSEKKGPKQSFEVTSTERVNFQPGGVIRLDSSYGYLTVEGWDESEVEVTATKSTDRFYEPQRQSEATRHLERIRVVTERRSDKELAISTILPAHNSFFSSVPPMGRTILSVQVPPNNKRGIAVDCTVHVPRNSRLIVRHDSGYVWVSGVTGDIEVRSRTGDMVVMLPDAGPYAIDARTGVGGVSSDLTGKPRSRFLVGTHFARASEAPARRIYLRMGRGSITIKNGPPSGPLWKD